MYAIPTAFVAALEFSGSDTVVVFVLFNLLKNAGRGRALDVHGHAVRSSCGE